MVFQSGYNMHKIKMSTEFDDNGHAIDYYFDHLYLSYQCKLMKPSAEIFKMMLDGQQSTA